MSRVSQAALTAAGFTQAGTRNTKVQGTATAVADTANGLCGIQTTTPGVPIAIADLQAHLATFSQMGVIDPAGHNVPQTTAGGLQYYGISS